MARKIAVFGAKQLVGRLLPHGNVKRRIADEMVSNGVAIWVQHRYSIQIVEVPKEQCISIVRCGQGSIYRSAGSTINRQYVQGGLTRTEHKPAAFHPFKGARIGHQ